MLSRRYGVIFVHVPKTAGQSIESVFIEREGLTWETRAPLLPRAKTAGAPGPERLAHLYADEYVALDYVTAHEFARFFKFAVVRDPYARAVSAYRYRRAMGLGLSMKAFLRLSVDPDSDIGRHTALQSRYLFDASGVCLVDKVLHFETLQKEFSALSLQIFGEEVELPRRNTSPGPPVGLTSRERAMIAERYAADFELLGYPRSAGFKLWGRRTSESPMALSKSLWKALRKTRAQKTV